jgi:hypothetical protein
LPGWRLHAFKSRSAALDYVNAFVEQAKKSGLVKQVIEAAGLRGVGVAQ